MSDLSHWNYATTFTGRQAAALILGYEPDEAWRDESGLCKKVGVVYERMQHDFGHAVVRCDTERRQRKNESFDASVALPPGSLLSVELLKLLERTSTVASQYFMPILASDLEKNFPQQVFTRTILETWVTSSQMASVYDFSGAHQKTKCLPEAASSDEVDPADLPDELYAANVAFRAVSNGHGDAGATFKNRLLQYLKANFDFSEEAIGRIATVANPDKSAGRKKRVA